VLCCCLQLNPNCLGFKLFARAGDPFFTVLSLLSLFGFLENQTRSKLLFPSLFGFFGSQTNSKFIGVPLLQMVLSILVGRSFHSLHSQVTSTFLGFLLSFEVLVVYLGWVIELFACFCFCLSL
jgi:hypothetical protein